MALTLNEPIGDGDGVALRRVGALSVQNDWWDNEPDYFDAIDQVMQEYGDSSGIDGFQQLLTEYRYLVSSRDDGSHLSEAGTWAQVCFGYCEPSHDRDHDISTLPVNGTVLTAPYGHSSTYVGINLRPNIEGALLVGFTGDATTGCPTAACAATPLFMDWNGWARDS